MQRDRYDSACWVGGGGGCGKQVGVKVAAEIGTDASPGAPYKHAG